MNELYNALAKLRAQRAHTKETLDKLDSAIEHLEVVVGERSAASPTPTSTQYQGLGIADAAVRYLKEVNRGASTREIADAIRLRGVQTNSRNYTATVYAVLSSARDRVHRAPGGVWTVVEQPEQWVEPPEEEEA